MLGPAMAEGLFFAALMWGDTYWCGGALIKPNVVVTAAHCLFDGEGPADWWTPDAVRIGWLNMTQRPEGGEEIGVRRVVPHPKARSVPGEYDLALLVLDRPSTHEPAQLPPRDMTLQDGDTVWAAGYSYTNVQSQELRWLYLQYHTPEECVASYDDDLTTRTFCTDGQDPTEGVCAGDSGSPIVLGDEPPYLLLGQLTSGYGDYPCAPGAANWWVSWLDTEHRRWLAQELRKLGHSY